MNRPTKLRKCSIATLLGLALLLLCQRPSRAALPALILPTGTPAGEVTVSVAVPPAGVNDYYNLTLSGVPTGQTFSVANGTYASWCVNEKEQIGQNHNWIAELFSTYAPNVLTTFADYPVTTAGWSELNYIINKKQAYLGAPWNATPTDIQNAIWVLLQGATNDPGASAAANAICADALANGANFVPGPGQVVAVLVYFSSPWDTTRATQNLQDLVIEVPVPIVTIGDYVWLDKNANGIQESGEPGIANVTLTLTGTSIIGQAITDHAVTGSQGQYLFTEPPGTYTVTVDASNFSNPGGPLAGLGISPTLQGGNTGLDSNPNPSGTTPTSLAAGQSDLTADFGYYPLFLAASPEAVCSGSPATLAVSVTNGKNPLAYQWFNGATPMTDGEAISGSQTATLAFTPATAANQATYTVVVTDATGASNEITAALTVFSSPTLTLAETDASCSGANNGSIVATITGGTAPFAIYLNNVLATTSSSSPVTLPGLVFGSYTVKVVDANSCWTSGSTSVGQPNALAFGLTKTDVNCYAGSDGTVTVTVSGGVTPYSVTVNGTTGVSTGAPYNATGLSAGQHVVSVTDAHLCATGPQYITLNQPTSALAVGLTETDVKCFGGSDGTVTATPSGGTSPYTVSVNGGAYFAASPSYTFSNLGQGQHTVIVKDAHSCSFAQAITVNQPSALSVGVTETDANCFGGNDGSVTVTITGGTAPYQVVLNGTTTASTSSSYTFNGLTHGAYTVAVTNAHQCSAPSKLTTVGQPAAALSLGLAETDVTLFAGSNGTVTATITGGTSPYNVSLDKGTPVSTGSPYTFSGLLGGSHSVSVTDAHGCSVAAQSITVNTPVLIGHYVWLDTDANGIQEPTEPGITNVGLTLTGQTTQGLPITSHTTTDTNGFYYFTEPAGQYEVSVDATNFIAGAPLAGLGVSPTDQGTDTTVDSKPNPSGTIPVTLLSGGSDTNVNFGYYPLLAGVAPVAVCSGTPATLKVVVTDGTAPVVYQWMKGQTVLTDGGTLSGSSTASLTINPAATTDQASYTVVVTDGAGASNAFTAELTVFSSPTLALTETDALCDGANNGSVTAAITGGTAPFAIYVNGVLATTTSSSSVTLPGLGSGSYSVKVVDANSCWTSSSTSVGQPQALTFGLTETDANCFGGSDGTVTVTVNGGTSPYTVTVDGGAQFVANPSYTFTGLVQGSHLVAVSDANQCTAASQSITVNQPVAGLTLSLAKTNVNCFGGSDGTVTATVSGGTGPYTVTIDGGAQQVASPSYTFTGLTKGSHSVTVVADAHNCSLPAQSITVNQPTAALSLSLAKTDVNCFGGSDGTVTATVSGGTGPYTVTIDGGAQQVASPSYTFTGLTKGSHSVTVVADAHNCSLPAQSITVSQPTAALSLSLAKTDVNCFGGSDGTVTATVSGGTGPYTVTIDGGAQQVASPSYTFTGLTKGSHSVTVVADAHNCSLPAQSITVNQPTAALSLSLAKTDVNCFGGSDGTVTATVSGGTGPYTVTIDGGAQQVASPSYTFTGLTKGSHSVTVVADAHNCSLPAQSITVSQPTAALSLSLAKTDVNCFGGSDGTVTATVSGGTGPYTVTIDGGAQQVASPSYTFTGLTKGSHSVTVVADAHSCSLPAQSITVNQPAAALSLSLVETDLNCFGGSDGTVTATVSGGTGPYTVTIDSGAPQVANPSYTFTGLTQGSHSVTVVADAHSCSLAPKLITVNQPTAALTESLTATSATVAGNDGKVAVTFSGGTSPYKVSVNGGTAVTEVSPYTVTGLTPGQQTIQVTDAHGCLVVQTTTVNQTCSPISHTAFTQFNASPSDVTTLWVNIHTELNGQLAKNGDFLWFTGGNIALTEITASWSLAVVPDGIIIATNAVTQPTTTYDSTVGIWVTEVPLGYTSSDIFISAGILSSTTGYTPGAAPQTVVSAEFFSDLTGVSSKWFYGLSCYEPNFVYTSVGLVDAVAANGAPSRHAGGPGKPVAHWRFRHRRRQLHRHL